VSKRKGGSDGVSWPRIDKIQTTEQAWSDYARLVLPTDAGDVQRIEMRKAFYAGFHTMLAICIRIGEPDIPDQEAMDTLTRLKAESESWIRDQIAKERG
jgi:hypothetical protein